MADLINNVRVLSYIVERIITEWIFSGFAREPMENREQTKKGMWIMASEEKVSELKRKLQGVFNRGFTLDADVMHFIDSTFLSPSPGEIREIMEDPSNCERDPLIELIFFPDEAVQEELEETLEKLSLSSPDEKALLSELTAETIPTYLKLASGEPLFDTQLPDEAKPLFLSRLKITKPLDDGIRNVVDANVDASLVAKVKVRLRNKPALGPDKSDFLCLYLEKVKVGKKIFVEYFDFVLGFLGETGEDGDYYTALIDKKRFYYQSIKQAEKFDEHLGSSNIETMIMKGITPLSIDKDDLRRKMDIIDRICQKIYGKTEFFGDMQKNVDLGSFHGDDKLADILKALT